MPIYLIYKKEDGKIEYTCDSGNSVLDMNLQEGQDYKIIDKNEYHILQNGGQEYFKFKDNKITEKTTSEKKIVNDIKNKKNVNQEIADLKAEIELLKKKPK
jgi:hypothetical protein